MSLRKASEIALEFVDWLCGDDHSVKPKNNALKTREALRQALAQKEWVGLTDEEKAWCGAPTLQETVARVEAKLKEKNT